jgi:hypothetical protein
VERLGAIKLVDEPVSDARARDAAPAFSVDALFRLQWRLFRDVGAVSSPPPDGSVTIDLGASTGAEEPVSSESAPPPTKAASYTLFYSQPRLDAEDAPSRAADVARLFAASWVRVSAKTAEATDALVAQVRTAAPDVGARIVPGKKALAGNQSVVIEVVPR